MAVGENTRYGKILAEWQVPEYIKYDRSTTWYIVMGGIGVILLIHALVTLNLLFAVIILLVAAIVYLHDHRQPDLIDFLILDSGIVLGERYYPYKLLTNFWIVYEPPTIKVLYFGLSRALRRELPIHLEDQNPVIIRRILLNYLEEDLDKEDEATEESLARLFRL
ncbi:MAG: hypothetical protein HYV33_00905 [Candidatus Kerfeldbacteria bacterium]|nr:hypothetical protein [Candidatus Kerfeldbacteria bacterium]